MAEDYLDPDYFSNQERARTKADQQYSRLLDRLHGGDIYKGEIQVKGDHLDPKEGDVILSERGFESRVDGSYIVEDSTSTLGRNLYDGSEDIVGFYVNINGDGTLVSSPNYNISSNITCKPNTTYLITGQSNVHYGLFVSIRDEDDNILDGSQSVPQNITEGKITTGNNASYFIMTTKTSAPGGIYDPTRIKVFELKDTGEKYSGIENKEWFVFGDSITAETTSINPDGSYTENVVSWPTLFKSKVEIKSWKNLALSGASWTTRGGLTDFQKVWHQVDTAIANFDTPDIVVFSAGTNDMSSAVTVGDFDTTMAKSIGTLDLTIFADAVRYSLFKIREAYPNVIIFVCTPMQTWNQDATSSTREPLHDMLVRMSSRYNAIIVNQRDELGVVSDFELDSAEGRFLKDGLHPNATGEKLQREFIYNRIKERLNNNISY